VQYYLHLFGSLEKFLLAVKRNSYLLGSDLETTVKPNVAFLRECGLGAPDVAKLGIRLPGILSAKLERVQAMVACAEGLVRGSAMFKVPRAQHEDARMHAEKRSGMVVRHVRRMCARRRRSAPARGRARGTRVSYDWVKEASSRSSMEPAGKTSAGFYFLARVKQVRAFF
jgi:hypothetical protein